MTRVLLLAGPAGAGKTTVGRAAAHRLGWAFADADAYHSPAALAAMAAGHGLTDADRAPWLARLAALVAEWAAHGPPTVLACSALKAAHRARLTGGHPGVLVAWLDVPPDVLRQRLAERQGHPVGPGLLPSQLAAADPPHDGLRLDGTAPVPELAEQIASRFRPGRT